MEHAASGQNRVQHTLGSCVDGALRSSTMFGMATIAVGCKAARRNRRFHTRTPSSYGSRFAARRASRSDLRLSPARSVVCRLVEFGNVFGVCQLSADQSEA